jgi:hypothetical protein
MTSCLVCNQPYDPSKLPLKLYCGDTICSSCLQINTKVKGKRTSLTCPICTHKFKAKIDKEGFVVINKKYKRVRDAQGVINVKVLCQIPPSVLARCFPVDSEVMALVSSFKDQTEHGNMSQRR